jgi:hypothetical protein
MAPTPPMPRPALRWKAARKMSACACYLASCAHPLPCIATAHLTCIQSGQLLRVLATKRLGPLSLHRKGGPQAAQAAHGTRRHGHHHQAVEGWPCPDGGAQKGQSCRSRYRHHAVLEHEHVARGLQARRPAVASGQARREGATDRLSCSAPSLIGDFSWKG